MTSSIDTLSSTYPKAKVFHSCVVCGGTIPPGERYQKWVYIDHTSVEKDNAFRCVAVHLKSCPKEG